jgi:hypothetical protein
VHPNKFFEDFETQLTASLTASASDARVAGFKSIVCYRTGLDVAPTESQEGLLDAFMDLDKQYKTTKRIRLANKYFNDHAVRITLAVAGYYNKPGILVETNCLN